MLIMKFLDYSYERNAEGKFGPQIHINFPGALKCEVSHIICCEGRMISKIDNCNTPGGHEQLGLT